MPSQPDQVPHFRLARTTTLAIAMLAGTVHAQVPLPAGGSAGGQGSTHESAQPANAQPLFPRDQISPLLAPIDPAHQPGQSRELDAQLDLLARIAKISSAPPWLAQPLGLLLNDERPVVAAAAATALGSVRTKDSAKLLLSVAGRNDRPRLASAALAAIARLTGRADIGTDVAGWERFLASTQWQPEAEWRLTLAEGLAADADAARAARDAALSRLSLAIRDRLQAAQSAAAREAVIRELLADAFDPLRVLGLELALQELANARTLGPDVAADASRLLSSVSSRERRLAAQLLGVIGSASNSPLVLESLAREQEPVVAAELLRAASRFPSGACVPHAMKWLVGAEPARAASLQCLAAALDEGALADPAGRDLILRTLRTARAGELPAQGLKLMLALGDDSDRQCVVGLVDSEDVAAAIVAAEAMSTHAPCLDDLVRAAHTRTELVPWAAKSLQRFRATAAGFRDLAQICPDASSARTHLTAFAASLPAADLVIVARSCDDPGMREAMLARLLTEPLSKPMSDASAQASTVEGLILLARTRLALRQPGHALKIIESIMAATAPSTPVPASETGGVAMLCLGRLAAADAVMPSISPFGWVEALEQSTDQAHAPLIVRAIEDKWGTGGDGLEPALKARFLAAKARSETFVGPSPEIVRP